MANALKKIVGEAKRIRKAHPNKYKGKKNPWVNGYMAEASKKYKGGKIGKRKAAKKKAVARAKKRSTRKKASKQKKVTVVKTVTRKATIGTRRRKRSKPTYKAPMRRISGKKDKTMLYLGVGALALGAIYLFTKNKQPAQYPNLNTALLNTSNPTRNAQSQDIVNYALAAGLALDAITKLINNLNGSSDNQVHNIYNDLNTTGQLPSGLWV